MTSPMRRESLEEAIDEGLSTILRRYLNVDPEAELPTDVDLVILGLDSLGAVSLVLELEETYGVEIPDALLTEASFQTAASIQRLMDSLRTARGAGE